MQLTILKPLYVLHPTIIRGVVRVSLFWEGGTVGSSIVNSYGLISSKKTAPWLGTNTYRKNKIKNDGKIFTPKAKPDEKGRKEK